MKMTTKAFTLVLGGCILFASEIGFARNQECLANIPASTPDARFINHGNGTLTDKQTGLMWKQCLEGQNGGQCAGKANPLSWDGAVNAAQTANNAHYAGYSDWRLPTVDELVSVIERQCSNPAVNLSIFPSTPAHSVWTGNRSSANAWSVDFGIGHPFQSVMAGGKYVRLVRNLH